MPGFANVGERILLVLWVGGMWTVGFVVAPTLFHMLPRMQAGSIAGQLFTTLSYVGLVCGGLLLIGAVTRAGVAWLRDKRVWALAAMVVVVLVGQFILAPRMQALKADGLPSGSVREARFMRLHHVATTLFVINSLLGLGLVAFDGRGRPE